MKPVRLLSIVLLTAFAASFFACSKTEYFKSESGLKKKLEGDWNLIPIPRTKPDEVWNFHDGKVVRHQEDGAGLMKEIDNGNFKVETSWVKSEIKIDGFSLVGEMLNGAWEVVRLDDEILVIATDHDGATGIMQREFKKAR